MKQENHGTSTFVIFAALAGAEILSPRAAANSGSAGTREFQFMALSLYSHGGEIPFSKAPTDDAARAAYPLSMRATTAVVALDCTVARDRALMGCKMNRSDPDDAKLKAAGLKLSHRFKVTSSYPYSSVTLFLQFQGKVNRCLMPFCFVDSIKPPPIVTTPH